MSKKNHLTIRTAKASDLSWIVQSQLEMAWESEKLKLNKRTLTQGVRTMLKHSEWGSYYLAQVGPKKVGVLLCLKEWSDWRNGEVWWIHSVWVEPDFRKLGVFKALYSHLKAKIKSSSKLRGLRLYVDLKNQRAQKVYKKIGMNGDHYKVFEWMKTF